MQLHHAVKINHILMRAPYPPAPQDSACGGGRASGAPFRHAGHPLSLSDRETFSRCPNPSPRTRPKHLSGRVSIWLCYSLWLFYLHSAVKIQPFYPVFPLAGATAKAFFQLSIWNFKKKASTVFYNTAFHFLVIPKPAKRIRRSRKPWKRKARVPDVRGLACDSGEVPAGMSGRQTRVFGEGKPSVDPFDAALPSMPPKVRDARLWGAESLRYGQDKITS